MSPLSILRVWITGLVAMAVVATAGYLAYDWYRYDRDDEQLYWAIGLGTFAILGRFSAAPFMGFSGSMPRLSRDESSETSRPDGTTIHVCTLRQGTGPVVVLTHGWSLNSSVWAYAERELPEECGLIVWDLRGLGQSSKSPANDYSIEAMAGDLLEIVKLAEGRPVVLVGHSIGGMICQTFCRLFPRQSSVSAIALCDTTYTNPVRTALLGTLWTALQNPLIKPLLHLTIWLSPAVWVMNVLNYLNGSTHWTTRLTSFAGRQTWAQIDFVARISSFASPAVVARGMLAMLQFDEQETLPKIAVPTEVVVGANDRVTGLEASEVISRLVPKAKLRVLTPGGHLTILERHSEVNRSLCNFVNAQRHNPSERTAVA